MLRAIFVIFIFVPGFLRALVRRFDALLLYCWFAFFRPQDWLWFDITGWRLSMVLGLVLVVPSVFSGVLPNVTHPLSLGSITFLLLATVAQTNAINPAVSLDWLSLFARLVLIALIATTLTTSPRRLLALVGVIAGSLGFHAAKAGLFSLVHGGARFSDGLSGAFIDNNGYALAVVMIIPLLIALSQTADLLFEGQPSIFARCSQVAAIAATPLCVLTVISTFSRGGFLGVVATAVTYVWLLKGRGRLALIACVVITAGVIWYSLPDGYVDRVQTIRTYEEVNDTSSLSRFHFWQVAMRMADAFPLGVGLRNFDYAYDRYDFSNGRYGHERSVHSSHFEVLAELGYAGLLVWIVQFAVAFRLAFRARARARTPGLSEESARFLASVSTALICSMVGFVVGGSFIALALNDLTWITFACVAIVDRLSTELCGAVAPTPAVVPHPLHAFTRPAAGRL